MTRSPEATEALARLHETTHSRHMGEPGYDGPTMVLVNRDGPAAAGIYEAEITALQARLDRVVEALTPSGYTKAAYIGEFSFPCELSEWEGEDISHSPDVPWTTIKEIMAAILARAALSESPQ